MAYWRISLLLFAFFLVSSVYCYPRRGKIVPNGSKIVSHGDHLTIQHPDGSSHISRLSSRAAKRTQDNGWIASQFSYGNYTSYNATWTVPPMPSNQNYQLLYFKNSIMDVPVSCIIQIVLQFYNSYSDGTSSWSLASWYTPWNGDFIEAQPVVVQTGDLIQGVIELIGNTWTMTGYVNGILRTQLQVAYSPNMYIEFPSVPNNVVATTSDLATQNYLTVFPYNASKTVGRQFIFTNDGCIRLAANNSLVMDVDGSVAKEGTRVLVYPVKKPISINQQWTVKQGLICSKLANGTYCLSVNNQSQVVISSHPQSPYINYQGPPSGSAGIAGSAQYALEAYNVFDCAQYPPSNRLNVSNIVLKKGTQTVTPTWSPSITSSDCKVSISATSTSATLTWDSTSL